jgi:hypothetical protein
LAEDQVAVALCSLQQEREQRLALKKEFEQVICGSINKFLFY